MYFPFKYTLFYLFDKNNEFKQFLVLIIIIALRSVND